MEDKSTNEKVGIFIIVFLLSLIVIIIILYLLGIFNRRPNEANIIVDDAVMFKYSKKNGLQLLLILIQIIIGISLKFIVIILILVQNLFLLLMVSGMYLKKIEMRLMYLEISYI